jgi:hypothetical protein
MEQQQKFVRCVNDKTGQVKMLSHSVAHNPGFMRKYKWRIEEVAKEPEAKVKVVQAPVPNVESAAIPEVPEVQYVEIPDPVAKAEDKAAPKAPKAPKAEKKPRKQTTTK